MKSNNLQFTSQTSVRRGAAALLFGWLSLSLVYATTIVPLSIERLTRESTHVVEAEAMDSRSQWNAQHTIIYTLTTFRVNRTLKGQAPETIVVRQLGGRVPHVEQKVAGVRGWQSGEQTVLFLRPSEDRDGTMLVTGLMQGDFRVVQAASEATQGQALVSNGVTGVESFEPGQQTVSHFSGTRISLSELEAHVRTAVAQ